MSSVAYGANAPMTPARFVEKWKPVTLNERAAAQSHFCDLCRLFDHPDPVNADPTGEWFTFEKGVVKSGGGDGFADVWKRDFFAWEYKKRKRNLDDALGQLARYALALENPPLHIACDTDRFRIVTAWTNTVPRSYELTLDDLLIPKQFELLRSAFYEPNVLKPGETRADLTQAAADKFSSISARLEERGYAPDDVAHFVSRLVFLFFAEDVKLLPPNYFRRALREMSAKPNESEELFNGLFKALRTGGRFGMDRLPHVNGGLFDDRPALSVDQSDVNLLIAAGSENWAHIDPTIFGTLFERLLDPDKRSQIGAHYTDAWKIMLILEPVLFRPLREDWDHARNEITNLIAKARKKGAGAKEWARAEERRSAFLERLRKVSILDAACGSGNFLYLALQGVKNLEHASNQECEALGLRPRLPAVGPEIVQGIEINPLAAELARTTIWIGDIQWSIQNGFYGRPEPILRPLDSIKCRDALMEDSLAAIPRETPWPAAEFIVGNPPFLGIRMMRRRLGHRAVEQLFSIYHDRVSREADLVCYWFEKALTNIKDGRSKRAGLVATNSIRGGGNRRILDQISAESRIFEAWSDEPWIVEGAAVRVSLVCFGVGNDKLRLDGQLVGQINSDLSSGSLDLTTARRLTENAHVASNGVSKKGKFEIEGRVARSWITDEFNPNKESNAKVLFPWRNGEHMTRSPFEDKWIINFAGLSEREASQFAAPFEYVRKHVKPFRDRSNSTLERRYWWRLARPASGLFDALAPLRRFIITPEVSKYRVFAWSDKGMCPDKNLVAIARDDDTSFGILQSRFHRAWALRLGTSLEDRPRYTCSTTFDTFPFPEGLTPDVPALAFRSDSRAVAIAKAACRLNELRNNWLYPAELVQVEPDVTEFYPDLILPRDAASAALLRERNFTSLYNQSFQWLQDVHADLDASVAAAYGWKFDISDEEALAKLLALNLSRSAAGSQDAPKRKPRVASPEDARQSPQFKLPIAGGGKKKQAFSTAKSAAKTPRPLGRRSRRRA